MITLKIPLGDFNMSTFNQLTQQKYINIETFRKSGVGVKTPVWFVQDGDTIFVNTVANSGKVKRIRNNGQVNIAACTMNGTLLGAWMPATAREVNDQHAEKKIDRLFDKKYGLTKKMFALMSVLQRRESTILVIKARE
jgi:PPOX class probable F420-dependent enzyme